MDKNSEGKVMEPPRVFWPDRCRGLLPITLMAGAMILPEVIQRKSLFSLLYEIDESLCEQTRASGCPIAGGRCTVPITSESLGVGPLNFARNNGVIH